MKKTHWPLSAKGRQRSGPVLSGLPDSSLLLDGMGHTASWPFERPLSAAGRHRSEPVLDRPPQIGTVVGMDGPTSRVHLEPLSAAGKYWSQPKLGVPPHIAGMLDMISPTVQDFLPPLSFSAASHNWSQPGFGALPQSTNVLDGMGGTTVPPSQQSLSGADICISHPPLGIPPNSDSILDGADDTTGQPQSLTAAQVEPNYFRYTPEEDAGRLVERPPSARPPSAQRPSSARSKVRYANSFHWTRARTVDRGDPSDIPAHPPKSRRRQRDSISGDVASPGTIQAITTADNVDQAFAQEQGGKEEERAEPMKVTAVLSCVGLSCSAAWQHNLKVILTSR